MARKLTARWWIGTLLMALSVGMVFAGAATSTPQRITIASTSGSKAAIVTMSHDPLLIRTADWSRDYLQERGFAVERRSQMSPGDKKSPIWVLEVSNSCPVAKSLGVDCSSLGSAKADAYTLSIRENGGRPVVCIVGRNVTGVRSGVARLVALLSISEGNLTAPVVSETRSPFFATRELMVANRGMVFRDTEWEDTLWRRWSDDRIRKYAEQIWLMGFNSLQTHEGRYYRAATADKSRLDETVHKTKVLMQAARGNGMLVTQFVWGQSPYNKRLCWNTPPDRAIMEEEFRWMASTYGKCVDRVMINFRDPGGCPRGTDCALCDDYRTPQEIASFILREYKKANPKVRVTLGTWFNPKFWDGTTGAKFLDETYSPREISIGLHKWYDAGQAKIVRSSGRSVDIWSWYLTDHETSSDMSLCMTKVDSFYSTLPDQASRDIGVISNELCFHGWPNTLTAYVSGQKMWNPRRPLAEIEREFCAGMFGEENADAMVAVYQACELVVNPARTDPRMPKISQVFGDAEYNKRFRAALEAGKKVVLDRKSTPTLVTTTEPQAFVDYLMRNLSLITILSEAQEQVTKAKQSHATAAELQKIVDDAEKTAEPYKADLDYPGLMKRLRDSMAH